MNLQDRVRAIREAGHVKRCHTLPHHGHYDVANHSWQALALLYALHPSPSNALIWALAFHDTAERYTGDIPAPAKWGSPELTQALENLELSIMRELNLNFVLTIEDSRWLQAIDRLELLLWCHDQIGMGNMVVEPCAKLLRESFRAQWDLLPAPVADFLSNFNWSRGHDKLP